MAKLKYENFEVEIQYWKVSYHSILYKVFFKFNGNNIINPNLILNEDDEINEDWITFVAFGDDYLLDTLKDIINGGTDTKIIGEEEYIWPYGEPEFDFIFKKHENGFLIDVKIDFWHFIHKYGNGGLTFRLYQTKEQLEQFTIEIEKECKEFLKKYDVWEDYE